MDKNKVQKLTITAMFSALAFAVVVIGRIPVVLFLKYDPKDIVISLSGLVVGCVVMTVIMLLWNYCITPIYMGYPRKAVAAMLLPVFLPFNLIKGSLNAAFVFLLYKPIVNTLRNAHLLPPANHGKTRANIPMIVISVVIIITCVLLILSYNKII